LRSPENKRDASQVLLIGYDEAEGEEGGSLFFGKGKLVHGVEAEREGNELEIGLKYNSQIVV